MIILRPPLAFAARSRVLRRRGRPSCRTPLFNRIFHPILAARRFARIFTSHTRKLGFCRVFGHKRHGRPRFRRRASLFFI